MVRLRVEGQHGRSAGSTTGAFRLICIRDQVQPAGSFLSADAAVHFAEGDPHEAQQHGFFDGLQFEFFPCLSESSSDADAGRTDQGPGLTHYRGFADCDHYRIEFVITISQGTTLE